MGFDEIVEGLAHHDPEVLQAHPVDALVHGWDQLDEGDDLAVEDVERLGGDDQGDGAAVPEVLAIGDRVAFEQRPDVDVLVPLRHADGEVAELVRADVDASGEEAVSLLRGRTPGSPR